MSRFVAEGSADDYKVEASDAWTKAKQEVDSLRKKPAGVQGTQEGGKSLYEHLQANKEKKQAEFEESQRLKNQFTTLSEDDVDFLDSVLASTRAKEAAEKQDTAHQLAAFRKQQDVAAKEAQLLAQGLEQDAPVAAAASADTWAKKRRRKDVDGVPAKVRKTSSTSEQSRPPQHQDEVKDGQPADKQPADKQPAEKKPVDAQPAAVPSLGLALAAYESDDE